MGGQRSPFQREYPTTVDCTLTAGLADLARRCRNHRVGTDLFACTVCRFAVLGDMSPHYISCFDNSFRSIVLSVSCEKKEVILMAIRLNEDQELVARIREGLKARGGYCPCRIPKTEEYKCICQEFKQQMADPNFEGYCHCMLYYKTKD